ncbi:MAG: ABC transporter permease subunit [Alphaproteobacteria bacterium]|nr:ABC transporter permease subunit [Alphaproteobacteria bacterium]
MRPSDRRALSIQVAIYLVLAGLALAACLFAIDALRARGIQAGFGFLWNTAGFDIGFTLVPFDATSSYGRAFLAALLNTLLVSALAIVLATAIGLVVAAMRLQPVPAIRSAGTIYVEAVRNTPMLLQLLALYFLLLGALPPPRQSIILGGVALINNRGLFLPAPLPGAGPALAGLGLLAALLTSWLGRRNGRIGAALGLAAAALLAAGAWSTTWDVPVLRGLNVRGGIALVPELVVLVIALSVYTGAFVAETFRSGFLSVAPGQWEAGTALGLGRSLTFRKVVLPQAVRACLPPLANQYVNAIKASSLAAAVGFPDLMQVFGKTTLNQTGQAVEVIAMTMAVYLAISLAVAGAVHWYEAGGRMDR